MAEFAYQDLLPLGEDVTPYRLLTREGVSTLDAGGRRFLELDPAALTELTRAAMRDIAHLYRTGHLQQLADILRDPEASPNDRFVALELLKNACVAAGGVLPSCQDTGTAIVMGKRGERVLTGGGDEAAIARGVFDAYRTGNLRYSQLAPLDMYREVNTGSNLPAQIEIHAVPGDEYKLLFLAKGGGSANKSFLFQETKALLNPRSLAAFLEEKVRSLGTAACPPYHLAVVIGGTSAEYTLKVAKLASARYLDSLPTSGNEHGRGFRDLALEAEVHEHDAATRDRRPVRREVLLPRRPGDPAARATAPPARWGSRCRARPTGRRWGRSRGTACTWSSSRPTPPASCPRSTRRPSGATLSGSTSAGRWRRSGPSSRATPCGPGSRSPGP